MNEINGFKLWTKEPNTICDGARVYTRRIYFSDTQNKNKRRLIRVYIPSTYDFSNPNKRFPVIYMLDGKNLFDDYTSFVGEWGVDETIEEIIAQGKTDGIIVVGVDAPKNGDDRSLEMIPKGIKRSKYCRGVTEDMVYANKLADYIFKIVKPIIDETFYTIGDKYHTGVGGSSMGGLMAFYLATEYSEYCNYSLAFSPAFFLFNQKAFKEHLDLLFKTKKDIGNIYFYVGNIGFEHMFVKPTIDVYEFMKSVGYNDTQIKYVSDSKQEHNEKAWRIYFPDAIEFFNYLK